jgi:hypothetical protein
MVAGLIHLLFAAAGVVAGAVAGGLTFGYLFATPPSELSNAFAVLMLEGMPGAVLGAIVGGFCGLWYGNRLTGD